MQKFVKKIASMIRGSWMIYFHKNHSWEEKDAFGWCIKNKNFCKKNKTARVWGVA